MDNKITIFVVTHKDVNLKKLSSIYKPIKVGKNQDNFKPNWIGDNTGDNISNKNKNYCELTAIYWAWKNFYNSKYIGICHYRRFFVKVPSFRLLSKKYILKNLNNYDVILPTPYRFKDNIWNHFKNSKSGREKDLISLRNLIKDEYSKYLYEFDNLMNGNSMSGCNMFITSKEIYDNYCEWLFKLMKKYEKKVDMDGYTSEEQRIYGYMAEFLLEVWIRTNKYKIKYENVLLYENSYFLNLKRKIRLILRLISYRIKKD